jgi:hypothetical protein
MPTDDEWADADELAEEMIGKPFLRNPEQGIADMQKRLRSLQARHDLVSKQADSDLKFERMSDLQRQMTDLKLRIKEYEAQQQGRN